MPNIISELNLVQLLQQQILRLVPENKDNNTFFSVIKYSSVICGKLWYVAKYRNLHKYVAC